MSELINFPREALAVPAADLRLMADALVAMQQACARIAATLIDRLDDHDGDPDLENATDLEDDHSLSSLALDYAEQGPGCAISDCPEEDDHAGGDVCDQPHDAEAEDGI